MSSPLIPRLSSPASLTSSNVSSRICSIDVGVGELHSELLLLPLQSFLGAGTSHLGTSKISVFLCLLHSFLCPVLFGLVCHNSWVIHYLTV